MKIIIKLLLVGIIGFLSYWVIVGIIFVYAVFSIGSKKDCRNTNSKDIYIDNWTAPEPTTAIVEICKKGSHFQKIHKTIRMDYCSLRDDELDLKFKNGTSGFPLNKDFRLIINDTLIYEITDVKSAEIYNGNGPAPFCGIVEIKVNGIAVPQNYLYVGNIHFNSGMSP